MSDDAHENKGEHKVTYEAKIYTEQGTFVSSIETMDLNLILEFTKNYNSEHFTIKIIKKQADSILSVAMVH